MTRRIVVQTLARRDIISHCDYLSRNSLTAALRFTEAIDEAFLLLADMPEIGELISTADYRLERLRRWPVPGFANRLIFYQPSDDSIIVVRVLHSSQDWQSILRTL